MARCDVCGNDYHRSFEITTSAGVRHTFDCFECAIQKLAPTCEHCGTRIIGHGMEANDTFFCCAHCARKEGVVAVADHA
jgi:hypothetical protein